MRPEVVGRHSAAACELLGDFHWLGSSALRLLPESGEILLLRTVFIIPSSFSELSASFLPRAAFSTGHFPLVELLVKPLIDLLYFSELERLLV